MFICISDVGYLIIQVACHEQQTSNKPFLSSLKKHDAKTLTHIIWKAYFKKIYPLEMINITENHEANL
jgi:hypothetical protein